MSKIIEYGFYTIDPEYLEYLNKVEPEVYYNDSYRNTVKPHVGIIVGINEYNYFVPLTSAKQKHKKWKNVSDEHFLIYEIVKVKLNELGEIYKNYSKDEKKHILSLIDIKK